MGYIGVRAKHIHAYVSCARGGISWWCKVSTHNAEFRVKFVKFRVEKFAKGNILHAKQKKLLIRSGAL